MSSPHSVDMVNKLLNSFKEGSKTTECFWIHKDGVFVVIDYTALHDNQSNYTGCLEVTREVSDIRALEGEKRLLD